MKEYNKNNLLTKNINVTFYFFNYCQTRKKKKKEIRNAKHDEGLKDTEGCLLLLIFAFFIWEHAAIMTVLFLYT